MNCDRLLDSIKIHFQEEKACFETIINNILKDSNYKKDYVDVLNKMSINVSKDGDSLFNDLVIIRNILKKLDIQYKDFQTSLKNNTFYIFFYLVSILFLINNIDLQSLLANNYNLLFFIVNITLCSFVSLMIGSIEQIYRILKNPHYKNYLNEKNKLQKKFNKKYHALDEKIAWYQSSIQFLEHNFLNVNSVLNEECYSNIEQNEMVNVSCIDDPKVRNTKVYIKKR